MKVSVVIMIYRPGYIDTVVQSLKDQTLKDFELVLVDDLHEQRKDLVKDYIGNSLNIKHIPPREVSPYSATGMAINTGIIHAEGELIYFMADYNYPHPRTLERHWEIYSKYGPKVIISGPLIDAIVASGQSISLTPSIRVLTHIKDSDGEMAQYPDFTPSVVLKLKDNFEESADNLISIWAEPFTPNWKTYPPDWRLAKISKVSIDRNLCENDDPDWFWGRNDSAPLQALLDVNGMNEAFDGFRVAADADLGRRLMKYGCRFLVDREAPSYMLPHPVRKRTILSQEESDKRIAESKANDYSLRAEREKLRQYEYL